jgi:hypothetical protein
MGRKRASHLFTAGAGSLPPALPPPRRYNDHVKAALRRLGAGRIYMNLWWMNRARRRSPWTDWHERHGAVFVHVPKTAGTSIYRIFGMPQTVETHCTALGYRSSNRALWDRAFRFTFVRNPWDRIVSAYHYLKFNREALDDAYWAARALAPFEDFASFVDALADRPFRRKTLMWRHFTPQWYFLSDFRGRLMVDDIARFENFDDEVARLAGRLQLPVGAARENAVPREHYSRYFDAGRRDIVARIYARDIALFGYSFEEEAGT